MARIIRPFVAWRGVAGTDSDEIPSGGFTAPFGSLCIESEGEVERKAGESERDEAIRWAQMGRGEAERKGKGRGGGWRERERVRDRPGDNYCRQREILFSMPGTARMHE